MPFVTFIYAIALILSLSLITLIVWQVVRSYLQFRANGLATCLETGKTSTVELDAKGAPFATPAAPSSGAKGSKNT